MDNGNENNVLRFLSLHIKDCLGCKDVSVSFPQSNNVHVILYSAEDEDQAGGITVAKTPVAQAIQLLCTLAFPDAMTLRQLPLLKVGRGSVSLRFQLSHIVEPVCGDEEEEPESDLDMTASTSAEAARRFEDQKLRSEARKRDKMQKKVTEVKVMRRFDKPAALEWVSYSVNGSTSIPCRLEEFHGRFFVVAQYSTIHLWDLEDKCAGNWLQIIQADANSYKNFQTPDNPFETFVKLFERQDLDEGNVICQLARSCVTVQEAVRRSEREFVLQVFNKVRSTFEYITMNKYTVWFLVPGNQGLQTLPDGEFDFDLRNVRTSIRKAGDDRNIYWSQSDHNIQDLLMISFQLALSYRAKQSLLIISHLEKLAEFVSWQFVTASYMNDIYAAKPTDSKWVCIRYLQRIVEVAHSHGNIVLIEYPSFLSLLSDERQVIKCKKSADEESWHVCVEESGKSESCLEALKAAINMNVSSS
ncbi:protein ORD [Drosophila guanche]|uniref:Blast:Protein ORD n=1 Tax=Drosophila guanche TaxID=7266 RepID=A0A3B0JJD1_DROGU|nr:protein ORD [Drosophila guanche]SPP73549.1 blast:Protein ORD [Drosophila guanche]